MKKMVMKLVLAAAAVFALGFVLVACGGEKVDYAGKYAITSMEISEYGVTMEGQELEEALAQFDGIKENYVEIKDSKSLILHMFGTSGSVDYTKDGNKLTASDASGTIIMDLNGDELSFTLPKELIGSGMPDCKLSFKKEK